MPLWVDSGSQEFRLGHFTLSYAAAFLDSSACLPRIAVFSGYHASSARCLAQGLRFNAVRGASDVYLKSHNRW